MNIHDATSDWITQPGKSACLPTCIYNVLSDISKDSRNIDSMSYEFKKISKEVEYDEDLGTPVDNAVSGIKRMFSKDKIVQWGVQTSEMTGNQHIDRICDIISSKNSSFPIVSLGPKYLEEIYNFKFEGHHFTWPSHTVIALLCDKDRIHIFDPYSPIGKGPRVRSLDNYSFEKYTLDASPRNWTMWFEMKIFPIDGYLTGDRK